MKTTVWLIVSVLLMVGAASLALGGQGTSGAPWFPDQAYFGKTEYNGTLYILFQNTGKNHVPGGIGNPAAGEGYREYVVEIQFILELVEAKGKSEPLYFTGIGKTCEDCSDNAFSFPDCEPGDETYYDWFYLPGDYVGRFGAALHSFLQEEVYPVLCNDDPGCQAFLSEAEYDDGFGNAEAVVDFNAELPSPPWYWVQPITIVTP